jgi:hypothetical protein
MVEMNQKSIFLSLLTLVLVSCHRTDEKFCSCMKKSEEVNSLTEKVWQLKATKKDTTTLKRLITSKNKMCEAYSDINGEELLKLKQDCK